VRSFARAAGALIALVALLVAVACSDDAGDPAADSAEGPSTTTEASAPEASTTTLAADPVVVETDDELYAVPEPIPAGEHGDLVRYQEVEATLDGARSFRVMYLSESVAGDPIVVTGTVVVPTVPAPEGGRPVLTIAHGTTGIADECAPSKGGGAAELAIAGPAVERGWIIAVTDYEGLGTPGRHPYLVGESEGRGVIDAALAAAQLPEAEASATTLIAGYSQGGHGALWADQVQPEWAPGLDVVGTFAGAPATELDVILGAAGSPGVSGFAAMIVAGFAAAYPDEADPGTFLTPEGVERLASVDEGCTGDVFGAYAGLEPQEIVLPDGPSTEPWPELARDNNPGQVATDDPILIIHSQQDETVPPFLSEILFERMCGLGQAAERRVLVDGGGHGPAAVVAYPQALEWFDQLLAGETVENTCP
jgi:pimeloyl-ACP methyl ester carboxylesterase